MRLTRASVVAAALVLILAVASSAAGVYTLAYWRQWAGGQPSGNEHRENEGNAFIRTFVFDEYGNPMPNVRVRFQWSGGTNYVVTDERGSQETGYQGNPMRFMAEDAIGSPAFASDWAPWFWNHDTHRAYEIGFLYQDSSSGTTKTPDNPGTPEIEGQEDDGEFSGGTYDVKHWWGKVEPYPSPGDWLLEIGRCPSSYSLIYNTPDPAIYDSGTCIENMASGVYEFGQTFVADCDRATAMRANLTKEASYFVGNPYVAYRSFRWAAQIFEGGPSGPPMGPKKILALDANSNDLKYLLAYGSEECALKPGNTYYVAFTAADGGPLRAWELLNVYDVPNDGQGRLPRDTYPDGTLYRKSGSFDAVPTQVADRDLQAYVAGMTSKVTSVGTIEGTLTGPDGQPVKYNGSVVLSPSGRRVLVGQQGTYRCYNVAPGTYSMTASAPGYQSVTLTDRLVSSGQTLTTNFTLPKDPGPIQITTVSGGNIAPGAQDVPITMRVSNTGAMGGASVGDVFVNAAATGPRFVSGGQDVSQYFTVAPDPGFTNPTAVRAGQQNAEFRFLVSCAPNAPAGAYTVHGKLDAEVNLQPNGSFEADASIPNYSGPTGWDWKSDEPPGAARLSYEHNNCYATDVPSDATKVTIRWVGKWSNTGSTNRKEGFRIYVAQNATDTYRLIMNIHCGDSRKYMDLDASGGGANPTVPANWRYYFTPNTYYQIDAWLARDDPAIQGAGEFSITITPLQGQGLPVTVTGTGYIKTASTERAIKWGKMSDASADEMSCREISYWVEGPTPSEKRWFATDGCLPTAPVTPECPGGGWGRESSGNQVMLPGSPWPNDAMFGITTASPREGSRALQAWCSPTGNDNANLLKISTGGSFPGSGGKQMMQVRPSTTYKASFWYKQDHYAAVPGQLRLVWEEFKWDAGKNRWKPYYHHNGDADYPSPLGLMPPFHWTQPEEVRESWTQRVYHITTTADAQIGEFQLRMDKGVSATVADVFTFDDFRLTELNTYADWDADSPGTLRVAKSAADIAAAKQEADGTLVAFSGVEVTGSPSNDAARLYVEDVDRRSGIVIDKSSGSIPGDLQRGERIGLMGVLSVVNGERALTQASVTSRGSGADLAPLGLTARALGGAALGSTPGVEGGSGLNNVGLLVTAWGRINSAGAGYFYIDDGSGVSDGVGTGVRVISGGIAVQPGATHAAVTGFSSVEFIGGAFHRVVRPRDAADIAWF